MGIKYGYRLSSLNDENRGYFFTNLGIYKAADFENGNLLNGRRSILFAKTKVLMKRDQLKIDEGLLRIIKDFNVESQEECCGQNLMKIKELGPEIFLRYMNSFKPSSEMFIYIIHDIKINKL